MKRIKWTEEKIHQEALKYKSRYEFSKYNSKAYRAAIRMGILDEVCSHIKLLYKYWTLEELIEEALKYNKKIDFLNSNPSAYCAAARMGILEKICSHMIVYDRIGETNPNFKYTYEYISITALQYNNRYDFQKYSLGEYSAAYKRGILDEVCSHMNDSATEAWITEEVYEEAKKYFTRSDFFIGSPGAYKAAIRLGILDDACSHMKISRTSSKPEEELFEILKESFPNLIKKFFPVEIPGKPHIHRFQVDILDPETKLGIEYDGEYHHSEEYLIKSKIEIGWPIDDAINYHSIKDDALWDCHGIKLLHIKGEEWEKDKQTCIDKCLEFLSTKQKKVA